jgi:putative nucleotidyltransferase with HDIG domain
MMKPAIVIIRESGMRSNIEEHSRLVMKVAVILAAALPENIRPEVELVRAGALLHDITKTRPWKQKNRMI